MSNYTNLDNLVMTTYTSIDCIKRMWNIEALCVKEMEILSLLIVQTPFGCEHSDRVMKNLYEDLNTAVIARKNYLRTCAAFHH